jgi:hypothetical protein
MLGNYGKLREPRIGVMLHYDGSTSDAGAIAWLLRDERCKVSYTDIVTDDGKITHVAPRNARAWHAGACKPSHPRFKYRDANSAFYGLSVACGGLDIATKPQILGVVTTILEYFAIEGWSLNDIWRITDHEAEAWPRRRKVDIWGDKEKRSKAGLIVPVLDIDTVREDVRQALGG